MKIQIYGMGCANCNLLMKNAKEAVKESDVDVEVVKVDDMIQIIEAGILATPGFAIDGVVKSMGRVLTKDEIKRLISGNL